MKIVLQPTDTGWLAMTENGTDGRHGASREEAVGRLLLDFPDKLGIEIVAAGSQFAFAPKRLGFIVRDKTRDCWHGRPGRYDHWNSEDPKVRARVCPSDYTKARIFASPTGVFGSLSSWSAELRTRLWEDRLWAIYELTDRGPVPYPTPPRWAVTLKKRAKKAAKDSLSKD